MHTCDTSLFRRDLPIFDKSPYLEFPYIFYTYMYMLHVSLFGISDLPVKNHQVSSLFPYLER